LSLREHTARVACTTRIGWVTRAAVMVLGAGQIQASCNYSPPPVLSQGQGADTLGEKRLALAGELGYGTVASGWNASNLSDVEVNSAAVGVGRLRYGMAPDIDLGLVGGVGPQGTIEAGPELKWRFARLAPDAAVGAPGFHAALISGLAVGTSKFRYDLGSEPEPRHVFLAPYTGVTASGGVELVQMFTGLRFAASETFGSGVDDLTLYPVLAFGVQLRPTHALTFYAEGDAAAGITTHDVSDTAMIGCPSVGMSVTFDER
jgi:hypothetical protein